MFSRRMEGFGTLFFYFGLASATSSFSVPFKVGPEMRRRLSADQLDGIIGAGITGMALSQGRYFEHLEWLLRCSSIKID